MSGAASKTWYEASTFVIALSRTSCCLLHEACRNILHWEQAAKTVSAMGQHVDSSRNARLLELTADSVLQLSAQAGKSTGQESVRNMNRVEAASLLEQACVAEPLNIRLRIKTARILASVARIDRAWEQLENASTTLSWLETTIGSITGAQGQRSRIDTPLY